MREIIRIGLFGASTILERVMCEAFSTHPNFIIAGCISLNIVGVDELFGHLKVNL